MLLTLLARRPVRPTADDWRAVATVAVTHSTGERTLVNRSLGLAGLSIAAALLLVATGCGANSPDGADGDNGRVETDPTVVLASSTTALGEESFRYEMSMGDIMSMTGAMDPEAQAGQMDLWFGMDGMEMEMKFVFIETSVWMNMGELNTMLGAETPWTLLDLSRVGPEGIFGFEPGDTDPAGATEMLQNLGEVEQVGDRSFAGVIDITSTEHPMFDDEFLDMVGEEAATLEFTATIDDQDRLEQFSITLPPMPDLPVNTIEMRFFDYGSAVDITAPPGDEVSEAPAEFYQMFQQ
jgi:hypothetical protein